MVLVLLWPRTARGELPSLTHDWFGAIDAKLTAILDSPAALMGAHASWLIDRTLALGLGGCGLISRHDVPPATRVDGAPSMLGMGYGGARVDYFLSPHRRLQLSVGTMVGVGRMSAIAERRSESALRNRARSANRDAYFLLEPELALWVDAMRGLRVGFVLTYRYVAGVTAPGMSERKLAAPSGGITIAFGSF